MFPKTKGGLHVFPTFGQETITNHFSKTPKFIVMLLKMQYQVDEPYNNELHKQLRELN